MLTKQDLEQIKEIVDGSIDSRVGRIIDQKLKPIKKELSYVKKNTRCSHRCFQ